MSDFRSWAQRRQSRGSHPQQDPGAPAPAPRAQQTLPPPPAGYAWGYHPSGNFVLVSLTATPAAPPAPLQPPVRQPSGVVPLARQPFGSMQPPGAPSKAVETCTLVKPGDKDPYADLLAQLPEVIPDTNPYDAMAGNPSPQTMAEMGGVTEFAAIVNPGPEDQGPARSFPAGAVLAKGSTPLRGTG